MAMFVRIAGERSPAAARARGEIAGRLQRLARAPSDRSQRLGRCLSSICRICASGHDADEVIDGGAVLEQHHRRQAANADLLRQFLLLVGVDLRELEAAAIVRGEPVEHRHELAAGAAPRRPEVDQHRHRRRRRRPLRS